ncbi:MAG: GlcNAc-transferase family protein, partial [Flammeovirgaceae bacterium]
MNKKETILLHLPAYRDPELIPTIRDALANAKYPKRIHFGICRQFNPSDKFDDLSEFKKDKRFKIYECNYKEAKGLPWARAI